MINYPDKSKFDVDSLDKQVTMVSTDSTITITNDELVSESLELSESLCSEDYLSFGAVESSRLKFTIKNTIPNTMNKWLDVTIMPYGAQSAFTLGRYKVYSDKVSSDRTTREIIAYDGLYKILSSSYKSWYKSIWGSSDTMTVKQFRDRFFDKIAEKYSWLTQENTTLLNDAVVLKKSKSIPRISGKDVFKAICEINGVFGHLGRDNVFRYVQLGSSGSASDISTGLTITVDHEDFNTTAISKMQILAATGDVLGEVGSGDNTYVIENNFLLKGLGDDNAAKDTADMILTHIFPTVSSITYVPIDAEVKGNPCYEVGDKISLTAHGNTFNTFMLQRELKGVQSLHDNYIASTGEQDYVGSKNANTAKMQKLSDGIGENEKAIELKPDVTVDTDVPDPSMGKTGDIHVQTGTDEHKSPKYEVTWDSIWCQQRAGTAGYTQSFPITGTCMKPTSIVWNESNQTYDIVVEGDVYYRPYPLDNWDSGSTYPYQNGTPCVCIAISEPGIYKWSCDIEYETNGKNTADSLGISFDKETSGNGSINERQTNVAQGDYYYTDGSGFNARVEEGLQTGFTNQFEVTQSWYQTTGKIRMWFPRWRAFQDTSDDSYPRGTTQVRVHLANFKFEKITDVQTGDTDGGYQVTDEPYVGDVSVKDPDGNWQTIQRITDVEEFTDPEESGLQVTENTRKISLKKNVVRARFRQQSPANDDENKNFAQLSLRCTGKPDTAIDITWQGGASWTNKEITKDSANVFKIKCGGSITANVDYGCYKITGLTSGKKYYFNMSVNISDNAKFGKRDDKSCGIMFTDSSTVPANADNISGHADKWIEDSLYYSFARSTKSNFINFDFTATASTMYMYFLTGDFTGSNSINVTLNNLVIAKNSRGYIRDLYMRDWENKTWLKYVPFTAQTGGGEEPSGSTVEVDPILTAGTHIADIIVDGEKFELYAPAGTVINSLDDIGDVEITSPTTGQVLKYNATSQKWENGADTGGAEAVEITWAAYQALTPAQKADATKVYYVTDYSGGGGGGGGGASITYGYDNPSGSATDGSLYILLSSINDKKQGEFLYMTNQWVLIDGYPYVNETKLYDNGTEEIAWEVPSGSGSKNSDNISLVVGAGNYSHYAITSDPVNITDFNTLSIQCRYRGQDYNEDLDISSYTGYKYISFTYLTDDNHNEVAVGLSDTKTSAATIRIDSRNGGTAEAKLYYMSLKVV